jgi:hemerythrin-like domain-containing protein
VSAPRRPFRSLPVSRRDVLFSGGGLAAGAVAVGAGWAASSSSPAGGSPDPSAAPDPSVIPPDDDLMREHGVLKRVLLCYREMIAQAQSGGKLNAAHVQDSALIIHDYIEGFHEGLEEGYVFPRLQSGQVVSTDDTLIVGSTVTTLVVQHARGRVITQFLLAHATARQLASPGMTTRLAAAMQAFDRMYEPHEAWEDTIVYPAFREIVPPAELTALGAHFAELERQQFHAGEFTVMVNRVAEIEQELGIDNLEQFTPEVTAYEPRL